MRLMIKQRVFAWTDTYDIYDEWGNKKYFVKSEAFRLTHQVHVYDIAGNEIGLISQRLFAFLPTFDICEVPLENTKQIPSYPKIQGYA